MNINELCKECHKTAVQKGFYDKTKQLIETYHDKSYAYDLEVSKRIALIQSELGESLEAIRKDKRGLLQKDTFEDELADTFIRLLDLCGWLGIDIEQQIEWKNEYNKTREKLHGKRF
jgi:NTP pyrophosphatase (non-canonical NTP hydrolase)